MCIRAKRKVDAFMCDLRHLNTALGIPGTTPQDLHARLLAIAAKHPDPNPFRPCGDCPACLKEAERAERAGRLSALKAEQKAVDARFPNLDEHNSCVQKQRALRDELLAGGPGSSYGSPVSGPLHDHYAAMLNSAGRVPGDKEFFRFSTTCQHEGGCSACLPPNLPGEHEFLRAQYGVASEVMPNGHVRIRFYPQTPASVAAYKRERDGK